MKTPPFLIAAALLFWGWQTGLWAIAIPLAIVFEGSRYFKVRWDFSDADFKRIWNLCTLLFLGALVLGFFSDDPGPGVPGFSMDLSAPARRSEALSKSSHAALLVFQWMPVLFLPLMVAQVFSTRDKIPLAPLSIIARRQAARTKCIPGLPPPGLNVSFCYFVSCILAASTITTEHRGGSLGFYLGLTGLLAWALWSQRNRRFALGVWGLLLALSVGLGYAGHQGIIQVQRLAERFDALIFSQFARNEFDPRETRTRLGSIGRIQQSGRIVLRVRAVDGPPPELLREASYNHYRGGIWYVSESNFRPLEAESDGTTWNLVPQKVSHRSVIISKFLPNGSGMLPCPLGTSQVKDLPAFFFYTNYFGAIKIQGPGLVSYLTQYDEGQSFDTPPGPEDLRVPDSEEPVLAQVADQLHLTQPGLSPSNVLETVEAYFLKNFSYSLYLKGTPTPTNQTELAKFLLDTHKGHCEYFATATVLLLRQAGIQARYAVGYSVQEGHGKNYVVRQRHAHAWCLVWYDGAWHDFDTTPPGWDALESAHASFFQPVSDFFSRVWFEFSKWRWGQSGKRKYVFWVLIPLLVLTLAQLLLKKQWVRFYRHRKAKALAREYPGLDSEFYLLLQQLEDAGFKRQPSETLSAWLQRIHAALPVPAESLQPILKLHYQLRFDPKGLGAGDRATLKNEVSAMLERIKELKRA